MKKKILLMLSMVAVLACVFALAVSAESVHSGKVDLNATVTLDDGTVCNLFDSEGNALIWFKNGSELQSIRADDERVRYKATYGFNVGNSTVGVVYAYEVSDMWIALESGNIPKGNIVVLNLMDDDVLVNEPNGTNVAYIGGPINCVKTIMWANKIIEYAYLRLDTIAIQANAFSGCTKLKYVNLPELTELRQIEGSTFGSSPALFSNQILDLSRTKMTKIAGTSCFSNTTIAGFKLPNTIGDIGNYNFEKNSALKEITIPYAITTLWNAQFNACSSLTTIYLSKNVTKIDKNVFNGCSSLEKIFFVGTKDEFELLLTNVNVTGNDAFKAVATNLISYKEYLALEDKSGKYAVYSYSYCEAYNEGKHTFTGNAVMQKVDYFKDILFADTCTVENCGMNVVDDSKTIGAIFVDCGYSVTEEPINGKHSMVQCYKRNQEAYDKYVALRDSFEFGVVVSIVEDPLNPENSGLIEAKQTYIAKQIFIAHDYFDVGVSGIGENQTEVSLVFCAYVIDNGEYYYLDGGETVKTATQKSHDDLSPKGV